MRLYLRVALSEVETLNPRLAARSEARLRGLVGESILLSGSKACGGGGWTDR